ncbi:glycosyltransferase family 4 protein [Brevundimonas sp.]|uniref:glycosyltransferase family 4 protein n=1 Tax=Brevundimonas sp. TaxID=1871086 RepID=UPI002611329F|nr:glycosyltransferase family 4 protein [Brevundimonas sp.]
MAFQESDELRWYATSYYFKKDAWPERLLNYAPAKFRTAADRQLSRRRFPPLDETRVRRALETEFLERPFRRAGLRGAADAMMRSRHLRFPKRISRIVEREPVEVLWATHDCLETFQTLKPRGVLCVLDQPIGHFASLDRTMREEHARHPDWFFDNNVGVSFDVLDRQRRAADIADLIVVGSPFAARTMIENDCDPAKVRIVPYGYDQRLAPTTLPKRAPLDGRPVEFLFVGGVGPRKGLAYLLKAFQQIDPAKARLTIVGPLEIPESTFSANLGNSRYLGPALRSDVFRHMCAADCFVFPSLFEGGGIVLYEAAACGLGVIQTDRCGDGVRLPANGAILNEISVEVLTAAIHEATDAAKLERWQSNSWSMRAERGWSIYRQTARHVLSAARKQSS